MGSWFSLPAGSQHMRSEKKGYDFMDDKAQIEQLYQEMYEAMVNKDEAELERVHDDTFVLIHMTGMHQSKKE